VRFEKSQRALGIIIEQNAHKLDNVCVVEDKIETFFHCASALSRPDNPVFALNSVGIRRLSLWRHGDVYPGQLSGAAHQTEQRRIGDAVIDNRRPAVQ